MANRINQFLDKGGESEDNSVQGVIKHLKSGKTLGEACESLDDLKPNEQYLEDVTRLLKDQVEATKFVIPTVGAVCGHFCDDGKIRVEMHVFVINSPFTDTEEKHAAMRKVGEEIHKKSLIPLAIAMLSECWMAENPEEGVRASEDPNRKEVIVVAGAVGSNYSKFEFCEFTRDSEDEIEILGEWNSLPIPLEGQPLLANVYAGFVESNKRRLEEFAGRPLNTQEDVDSFAKEIASRPGIEKWTKTSGSAEPEVPGDEQWDDGGFQKWLENL